MGWRRIVYLISLTGCVAFYLIYREWLSGVVLTVALGLPLFSLLVSLPAMVTTRLELEHPQFVPLGEEGQADIWVCCNLPAPPAKGRIAVRNTMTGEAWDDKMRSNLPTNHCGQLVIKIRGGWIYDYLGLFRIPMRKKPEGTVLVRPDPIAMEEPPNLGRFLARSWRPKRGGGFGENHELRLYRPGDSLQQIHWKLTAKTGKLILRETVEPEQGLVLLKLDLAGTEAELDEKLGRLLWLSRYLLAQGVHHEIRALTGEGLLYCPVKAEADVQQAVDRLLCTPCAEYGSIQEQVMAASWEYYIGGGTDEEA